MIRWLRRSRVAARRVAFLSHSPHLGGGSERALLQLLSVLDRNRTNPLLLVPSEGPLSAAVGAFGVRYRVTPLAWWIPATHWSAVEFLGQLGGLEERASALERLLREEKIEVVHSNVIVTIEGALAAAQLELPHVWHTRGLFYERFPPSWFRDFDFLFGVVDSLADTVICMSEAIRRQTAEYCRRPRLVTIYDGFDAEAFLRQPVTPDPEFRARYGIPREIPLVATVGGIQRRKGLIDVVEAAALLRERHRIVVLFAGAESDPEFAAQLSARIGALGLEGSFRFLGYQSNVHDVLARCEMLVHPAHSEGLGIVLMEAMAAGKPIVATRSGGPEEMVVEGETGLLVPPGEPRLLANAMDTLLSDPSTAIAMGRAGRARIRGFSPEDTARQTEDLYDGLGAASSDERANRRRVAAELPDEILGRARRAVAEARS